MPHTPEPMRIDPADEVLLVWRNCYEILSPVDDCSIAVTRYIDDARLFAVAPSLLAMCKNLRDDLGIMIADGLLEYYDFSRLNALIAKAEGNSDV